MEAQIRGGQIKSGELSGSKANASFVCGVDGLLT